MQIPGWVVELHLTSADPRGDVPDTSMSVTYTCAPKPQMVSLAMATASTTVS